MSNSPLMAPPESMLRVTEALGRDVGRNVARIHPQDLQRLCVTPGGAVEIAGRGKTVALALETTLADQVPGVIQVDGITRRNADVGLEELVAVQPIACEVATAVSLAPTSGSLGELSESACKYLGKCMDGTVLVEGDLVRVSFFGTNVHDFRVLSCEPKTPVKIQPGTRFLLQESDSDAEPSLHLVYEDIGGLRQELGRLREMVEIPLKYPQVFVRLGVVAPRGILLTGPTGVGKSLLARVLAEASQARFYSTSGPQILNRYYNRDDSHLRHLFDQAQRTRPAVIFIDEVERVASQPSEITTEAEKHLATELLALMDQLERNGRVVVIGASAHPDEIDPTFRRHGRFEREISVRAPRYKDRLAILEIHSRGIPLDENVDLGRIASLAEGFVGADLDMLCQEAALQALRQHMRDSGAWCEPTFEILSEIRVAMAHFLQALQTITPSLPQVGPIRFGEVDWGDIGGLHEVRKQLVEAVLMPLRSPQLFSRMRARPVRGVLLHGPPGAGKTLLARALAKDPDITFLAVKAADFVEDDIEAGERAISHLFRRARQGAPSILFFDEIDALASPDRPGSAERALGRFMAEMDRAEELPSVIVLSATNRLDALGPTLFRAGRFDLLVEVPLPDSGALTEIFQIHLRDRPLADDVDLGLLVRLAGGFSGADVEIACQMAATHAIRECVAANELLGSRPVIAQRHLAAAIAELCMQKLDEK